MVFGVKIVCFCLRFPFASDCNPDARIRHGSVCDKMAAAAVAAKRRTLIVGFPLCGATATVLQDITIVGGIMEEDEMEDESAMWLRTRKELHLEKGLLVLLKLQVKSPKYM